MTVNAIRPLLVHMLSSRKDDFASKMIQGKYRIGSIGSVLQKIPRLNSAFWGINVF